VAALLEINNLNIRFGAAEVVHDLSLAIEERSTLGLVGESGSGKSVTALAIMRLLDSRAQMTGSIRFAGRDLLSLDPEAIRALRGKEIAMVFQEPMTALNPVMSVGRQIGEAILAHATGLRAKDAKRRAIEALESVAIPEAARRFGDYPHQFSGGQRQRILIAMALVHKPQLLIADEPTTALDVTVQAQVLELMKTLQRERGLAMLFTSHDLAVVGQMADRVAVMRRGEMLESGSVWQVLTDPQHPYTKSLLSAVPTLRTDRNRPLAMVGDSPTKTGLYFDHAE
jgi:peptide/nickel transport system ATP-binding protein